MKKNSSSTAPRFRLLVHGQDGTIPYLTPELIRLMFFPNEDDHQVDDAKLHREHIILGLAVKDTCITPNYQDKASKKTKRKHVSGVEENGNAHRVKQMKVDAVSSNDASSTKNQSPDSKEILNSTDNQQQLITKKPTGYSFLNRTKSTRVSDLLNRIQENDANATSSNYMQQYLRTPPLATLIAPTFSFINENIDLAGNLPDQKKYISKKQEAKQASQHKICCSTNNVIPKSSKNAVSIETPHGWQSIGPEQYCEALSSLTHSTKSELVPSFCEGAIGLFDYVDISSTQADSMFLEDSSVKNCNNREIEANATKEQARKQALKKITMAVQKGNGWACQVQHGFQNEAQQIRLWLPIQILSSKLPSHVMFTTPKIRPNLQGQYDDKDYELLTTHSNIAIVGWEALTCGKDERRDALRNLISTAQSTSTNKKQFLLLAVNDLQSILDAAREGISIIGTDMARTYSRNGIALCISYAIDGITVEELDMKDTRLARDFDSILSNCTCLACRQKNSTKDTKDLPRPTFTRAYIHHLFQAKEMLAEILLFAHNLHQLLLLFRKLSDAAEVDEKQGDSEHLEAFCRKVEQSLAS
ncbi:hypothetical protein ACHAWC_007832 [Mediolabrus comicus]